MPNFAAILARQSQHAAICFDSDLECRAPRAIHGRVHLGTDHSGANTRHTVLTLSKLRHRMKRPHPYASGNYQPIHEERSLAPCTCDGALPAELAGGIYVRNGSNPMADAAGERPYHWFDGDGMLHGVFFDDSPHPSNLLRPTYVNRYVLSDVLLATRPTATLPILPSITTLLGSLSHIHLIIYSILRCVYLVALSFWSGTPVRRISVANTSVLWHDGRALVGCESGPLGWIQLPALETVGWWDLEGDGGEVGLRSGLGGWMKEWTTAHPKLDPVTGELILFHSTMVPPFLSYSVVPSSSSTSPSTPRIIGAPVPISGPRMMHDFAASHSHTVLLDLPLSLNPLNLLSNTPVVSYSPSTRSRFGILPRHAPDAVQWFSSSPCIIFHTAYAYNSPEGSEETFNLVCCRLNSSRLIYAAGDLPSPPSQLLPAGVEDTCLLHYYQFLLSHPIDSDFSPELSPSHSFPLSAIPFEFPVVPIHHSMSPSQFVYGCSMRNGTFSAALGKAAKIDCLVKIDSRALIAAGIKGGNGEDEPVDERTVAEILAGQHARRNELGRPRSDSDTISVFALPENVYAQEPSFVPRAGGAREDDGWLLTYVFDEAQLDEAGEPRLGAKSELWVIDAADMETVVARVLLPQRVPYGLHGTWFTKEQVESQRPVSELRSRPAPKEL